MSSRPGRIGLFVHFTNVLWWSLIYLGSWTVSVVLARGAEFLRANGSASSAAGIDSILRLFDGWLKLGPWALAVFSVLAWPFYVRSARRGAGIRSNPAGLLFGLLLRR